MKAMTRILLLASLILLCLSSTVFSADAGTLHALLVIMDYDHTATDNDPGIGPACVVNQFYIEDLLASLKPGLPVEVKTLLSSNGTATFAQMEQWLKSIQPGNEDLVFVYYSGHGGMENWETKRTFICTLDEYYPRRDTLVNSIEAFTSTARLRILITDCCSSTSEPPPVQVEKASALLSEQALKDLFLYHTGFLHITGATEGQYGWTTVPRPEVPRSQYRSGGYGSWFTTKLLSAIEEAPDGNSDGFVSWTEVFELTVEKTEARFRASEFSDEHQADMKRLRITSQTPKAYSLPESRGAMGIPPIQLKGNVFIRGVDDEGWFEDETGELDHDVDIYLRTEQTSLQIPHFHWGGECRVELDLSARLVDIGIVEIWGSAKLFEGLTDDTGDEEDAENIHFRVPMETIDDIKEALERQIIVTSLEDYYPTLSEIEPPEPVERSIHLENRGTGGGDTADISLTFTVETINVDATAKAYVERGKAEASRGNYEDAIAYYTKARRVKPTDSKIYYWRGVARAENGETDSAVADFNQALQYKYDDVYAYHWRGTMHYASARYEMAIDDFSAALSIDPDRAEDYYWRGMAKYQLEQYEAATADFDAAIRLDSNHAYAYHARANTNEKLGRTSAAIRDFQASLRLTERTGDDELKTGNQKWLKALSK